MDIGTISQGLTAVKGSIAIAKALKDADTALQVAEIKSRMLELVDLLVDAKDSLVEARITIDERNAEVERLNEALELQAQLEKFGDAYFKVNSEGHASGDPLCAACWEAHHKAIHITRATDNQRQYECPLCHHRVLWKFVGKHAPGHDEPPPPAVSISRI